MESLNQQSENNVEKAQATAIKVTEDSSQTPETFSEADKETAEKTVRITLGVGEDVPLDNFGELLASKVKEVPRYAQIAEALKDTEGSEAVYALFKQIQRANDTEESTGVGDGVLVQSMKEGRFGCAGRALLSSTVLSEKGIPHSVAFAPKHSFLVVEISDDTLAYFDAQANMYFTFPKDTIGYQGQETTQRYKIGDFTAREGDQFDGLSLAHNDFLAMDPREALSRQYLMNVSAALNGNEEFLGRYRKDEGAALAVSGVEKELIGERPPALDEYYSHMESMAKIEEAKGASLEKTVREIFNNSSDFDNFLTFMVAALQGELGDAMPYLKGANQETKVESIKKIYDNIKNEGVHMSEVDEPKPTDQTIEGPEALAERLEDAAQADQAELSTSPEQSELKMKAGEALDYLSYYLRSRKEGGASSLQSESEDRERLALSLLQLLHIDAPEGWKSISPEDVASLRNLLNSDRSSLVKTIVESGSLGQVEVPGYSVQQEQASSIEDQENLQYRAEDALDYLSYYLRSRKEGGASSLQSESPEREQIALSILPIFHVVAPEGWKSINPEDVSTIRKALNGDRTELVKSIVESKLL